MILLRQLFYLIPQCFHCHAHHRSIIIRYEQAVDPRTVNGYQGTRPVMAGLRHRLGTPSPGAAGVFGTNADGVNNPNVGDWPSTVLAGRYIPRASAITGSTVTYEPVACTSSPIDLSAGADVC